MTTQRINVTRRNIVQVGIGLTAAATVQTGGSLAAMALVPAPHLRSGKQTMGTIRTKDGADIFFKDWGSGPPVVFSHGWPLNSDAWEAQMFAVVSAGFRAIAHDRRGHGRSTQTWAGNDMDTYADDLAQVLETRDVHGAVLVGHSTGGGEVARYIGRHGTRRVKGVVLVSAVTPTLMKSAANPNGVPKEAFDKVRQDLLADTPQYWHDLAEPFFGANRPGSGISRGIKDAFWRQSMFAGLKPAHDCIQAYSESVFFDDLKRFDKPTLIVHGEDDQICPIDTTGRAAAKLVPGAALKVYPGAPHGLPVTHHDMLSADLLAFART